MSEPTPTTDPAAGTRAYDLDRAHVFHSWSAQGALDPLVDRRVPRRSYVWDYDGNRYLDFSSQLVNVNIGHQHPKVVAAIQEQAAKLATIAPQHANDTRGEAARRIAELAPDGHQQGVLHQRRRGRERERDPDGAAAHRPAQGAVSFYRSYHGNTGAAIVATGDPRRWPNEYADGHVHFFGPYLYRSPFWADNRGAGVRARAGAPRAGDHASRARGRSPRS